MKAIRRKRFHRFTSIIASLGFEASFEEIQELLLVFREEGVGLLWLEIEYLRLDHSKLDFVAMDLSKAIKHEIHSRNILHVENFHHVGETVVCPILLAGQDRRLIHLFIVKLWLEADELEPV